MFIFHPIRFLSIYFFIRGCGAFRGDPKLKFLIQLIAASLSQRKLIYLTYNDIRLKHIKRFVSFLYSNIKTVGCLMNLLHSLLLNYPNQYFDIWNLIMMEEEKKKKNTCL